MSDTPEQMQRFLGTRGPYPALLLKRYSPRPNAAVVWTEAWQARALAEATAYFNLAAYDEVHERMVSGRKAKRRPGIERAIELAEQRKIRVVAVADWRRFSRDDPGRVLMLVGRLQEMGVVVLSNTQRDLVPWQELYWVKLAFYAETANREAVDTAATSAKAIREARERGVDWGKDPLGWRRLDYIKSYTSVEQRAAARRKSFFVPDESDGSRSMAVLKEAYQLRAARWSWRQIGRKLGLAASSVMRAVLGVVGPDGIRSNVRNREQVGADLYDLVISMGPGGEPVHTARRPWFFRGMVYCPFCESRMSGSEKIDRHRTRYYDCDNARNVQHSWTTVREDMLLAALRRDLAQMAFNDEQIARIEKASRAPRRHREVERNREKREAIQRLIRKANVKFDADGLTEDEYRAQIRDLRARLAEIPNDPPELAVVGLMEQRQQLSHLAELLPIRPGDPAEVKMLVPILRRVLLRVDLDKDTRRPAFTYAPLIAEIRRVARAAGVWEEGKAEERDWLSPAEVSAATGWSRSTVSRCLRAGTIPADKTDAPRLGRYHIPRAWAEAHIGQHPPGRTTSLPPADGPLTIAEVAELARLGYRTVLGLVRSGRISSERTGEGRHTRYRIPPDAIASDAITRSRELSTARRTRAAATGGD